MTRRARRGPAGLAAAVALVGAAAGCALLAREPTVRIAGVRLTGVGLGGATAEIEMDVDNPNGFSLTATGVTYRLAFGDGDPVTDPETEAAWRTIAEGESDEPVTLPGEGTRRVTLSVPFRYEDVGPAIQRFLERGEIRYRLTGAFRVDAPLREIGVPFDDTGDIGL